jgi:hypothetical protein
VSLEGGLSLSDHQATEGSLTRALGLFWLGEVTNWFEEPRTSQQPLVVSTS